MHDVVLRHAPPHSTPGQMIVRFGAKALIFLFVALGVSIVSFFRAPVGASEPTVRLIWCAVSIVTLFAYVRGLRPNQLQKQKTSLGVLSALVAWSFATYLCLYLGSGLSFSSSGAFLLLTFSLGSFGPLSVIDSSTGFGCLAKSAFQRQRSISREHSELTSMKYFLAALACAGIIVLYAVIGALLHWKQGGGVLPMLLLFALVAATWGAITKKRDKTPPDNTRPGA